MLSLSISLSVYSPLSPSRSDIAHSNQFICASTLFSHWWTVLDSGLRLREDRSNHQCIRRRLPLTNPTIAQCRWPYCTPLASPYRLIHYSPSTSPAWLCNQIVPCSCSLDNHPPINSLHLRESTHASPRLCLSTADCSLISPPCWTH